MASSIWAPQILVIDQELRDKLQQELDFQILLLEEQGYTYLGPYAADLEFTDVLQFSSYNYLPIVLKDTVVLPYTTTGVWEDDEELLFTLLGAGDANLREELADPSDIAKSASLVALFGVVAGRSVQTALESHRKVEDFGPVGLGNDTPTLHLAFAWLQAEPGRTLELFPGRTYIQGPGDVEVEYEGSPYFPARFNFLDQRDMTLIMNGATIEADTALTDTQFNRGLWFYRCNNLSIWSGKYDGRLDARTPFGSDAFNDGNELTGNGKSGIALVNCRDAVLYRVESSRTMMDGFFPVYESGVVDSQTTGVMINCEGHFNYRQGLSIVGAKALRVEGGKFNDTGNLGAGKGTAPMAGIDIETDGGLNPITDGNIIIGVECARNQQGISFNRGAQNCVAIGCSLLENRVNGVSFSGVDCSGNKMLGGSIVQTHASVLTGLRTAIIDGSNNGCEGVEMTFSDPHRGVSFVSASTCIDGYLRNNRITDIGAATDVTANPFAILMAASAIRQVVIGNTIRNVTGTGFAVTVNGADSRFTDGNYITSAHGVAGARGVNVIAGECHGNTGGGTRTDTALDLAVFNLSGVATTVKQLGPNVDNANPRMGQKVRNLGFAAGPYRLATTYNTPSLAANAHVSPAPTFTVTGSQVGDFVEVSFGAAAVGLRVTGMVSAVNTVRLDITNVSGGVLDAGETALNITVLTA